MLNYLYKIGNFLYRKNIPFSVIFFKILIRFVCNSVVNPKTEIGEGTVFAYGGISVIIHEKAKIGKNCMIGTNITIGGRINIKNVPVIGDNVYIGASAIIIGDIKIGNNSTIGAGAVVLQDVPSGKTVVGNPARIIE